MTYKHIHNFLIHIYAYVFYVCGFIGVQMVKNINGIKKFIKKDVEYKTHRKQVTCGQRVSTCLFFSISTIDLVNYLDLLI